MQIKNNRYFLHEHPRNATSWKLESMQKFINKYKPRQVKANMCAFNMTSTDEQGTGLVLKPTTFMTNSHKLAAQLSKQCNNNHRHVILINGRAKQAAVYPDALCDAICRGIREQIDHDQLIERMPRRLIASISLSKPININSVVNDEPDAPAYYDDVTGV